MQIISSRKRLVSTPWYRSKSLQKADYNEYVTQGANQLVEELYALEIVYQEVQKVCRSHGCASSQARGKRDVYMRKTLASRTTWGLLAGNLREVCLDYGLGKVETGTRDVQDLALLVKAIDDAKPPFNLYTRLRQLERDPSDSRLHAWPSMRSALLAVLAHIQEVMGAVPMGLSEVQLWTKDVSAGAAPLSEADNFSAVSGMTGENPTRSADTGSHIADNLQITAGVTPTGSENVGTVPKTTPETVPPGNSTAPATSLATSVLPQSTDQQ